jgi:hypothetical protein
MLTVLGGYNGVFGAPTFITVFMEGIIEGLGWMRTRPVRNRRTRVESSEKWQSPISGRKLCGQVCARTLGEILSSLRAERVTIQESG